MMTADLIPLHKATCLIPGRQGRKQVHANTLFRWCLHGVRGVKLRSVLVGGQRYTTQTWVDEFLAALNPTPRSTEDLCHDRQS
jgi:hypothetical protein